MSDDFVGRGWNFPLSVDATGRIALAERERKIEQSIRLILGTAYGERPMRPEFGCGIHDHLFDGQDAGTIGRIASEVRASLERWEPRITVNAVEVTASGDASGTVWIDIRYLIRGTNDARNLVFPFYVIPEQE